MPTRPPPGHPACEGPSPDELQPPKSASTLPQGNPRCVVPALSHRSDPRPVLHQSAVWLPTFAHWLLAWTMPALAIAQAAGD